MSVANVDFRVEVDDASWSTVLEAQAMQHRREIARLEMQIVRYRRFMREHGIEPPDTEAEELERMWNQCRAVISTASEFVATLGTAKELLT